MITKLLYRALWAVRKAKHAKLIYDITEWYPALSSLNQIGRKKYFKTPLMFLAKIWTGFKVDAFIFGEYYKSSLFRLLFPYKPALTLPYYPCLRYFTPPHGRISILFYNMPDTLHWGTHCGKRLVKHNRSH